MANELSHIALANRNHEALCVLLGAPDEHPEWVAIIAFYKALQIVEAAFVRTGVGHGCGHSKRLQILQDKKNRFTAFCKHYEALLEASEVARYLGSRDRSDPGGKTSNYTSFATYMPMEAVKTDLLQKRLMNVEMHARAFLSDDAKKQLKQIQSAF